MTITTEQLKQKLIPFGNALVSGVRRVYGKHICALELASLARNKSCSDRPLDAGLPDIRYLNDAQ